MSARSWQSRRVLGNLSEMEAISPRSGRDLESQQTSWRDLGEISAISARSHQSRRDLANLGEISVKILHGWYYTSNNFCIQIDLSINPRSVEFHQCHAKPHLICFFFITLSKITKEIFAKICWELKTPTRKVTGCIMQMSFLYASDFLSKTFAKSLNIQKQYKKCLGKEQWRVLVVDKSTDQDKPHFNFYIFMFFYDNINFKENIFFQSESWERHCATHWREQHG